MMERNYYRTFFKTNYLRISPKSNSLFQFYFTKILKFLLQTFQLLVEKVKKGEYNMSGAGFKSWKCKFNTCTFGCVPEYRTYHHLSTWSQRLGKSILVILPTPM